MKNFCPDDPLLQVQPALPESQSSKPLDLPQPLQPRQPRLQNSSSTTTSRVQLRRRRLLFALPGGVVAASPLALFGCGGDDNDATANGAPAAAAPSTADLALINLPPGDVTAANVAITIQLPSSLSALSGLRLVTASGAQPLVGASAQVAVFGGGPQLVTVEDSAGTPLLLGWVGGQRRILSLDTTAAVLLHFGLGLPFLDPDTRDAARDKLEQQPAVSVFAAAIGTALAADRRALATLPGTLQQAFLAAGASLLPGVPSGQATAGRVRALGLVIDPADQKSGIQVVQGQDLNTFFADNSYMRRAVVIVNREAYVDSSGNRIVVSGAPVQVGDVVELPLPTGFDSLANTISGWATQLYSPDDPNGFFRSATTPVTLAVSPADAKRTEYKVVVLMAGGLPMADTTEFDRLPALQKSYLTGLDVGRNLLLKTLLVDLLGPLLLAFVAEKLGEFGRGPDGSQARQELLKSFASQLLTVLQNRVPDVVDKLAAQQIDPWSAFKTLLKAMTFDPATGEISPLLVDALSKLAEVLAARLADPKARASMLEVVSGVKIGGRSVDGIIPALGIIQHFDEGLGYLQQARFVGDLLRSRRLESWTVNVTRSNVRLSPDPLVVEPTGITYPVKVEIVDNDNDEYGVERGSINFDWVCTGHYGRLFSPADANLSQPNRFTSSRNNATVNYLPNGTDPDPAVPETIKVSAYFEPIGSKGTRTLIGSASLTITFKKAFSLKITPSTAEVPTNGKLNVSTQLVERLPSTATVRYEWELLSGGGSLQAGPDDSHTSSSYVTYAAPASETTAVVQVRAVVTPDPSRASIRTDPVTATLSVKAGLRTLTLAGSWIVESSTGTADCAQCGEGGTPSTFPTYRVTAYVVVPKVPGARSYSVLLEKATPDVPGGVPFPSTRGFTPGVNTSGWEDRGGAWYSGLSGASGGGSPDGAIAYMQGRFSSMRVTVTVTLP